MARRNAFASVAAGVGAAATLVGEKAVLSNGNCSNRFGSEKVTSPPPPSDRDATGRGGHSPPATLEQKPLAVDVADLVPSRPIATSPAVSSSGDPKMGSTYADRFVRLIHLMDPRHTMTTEGDIRRYQRFLKDHTTGESNGSFDKDLLAAAGKVDASCNVATGEVIPAPFRLSGYLLCNIPVVAIMLFSKSVYVQVFSHWVNQSLNTAVNYYNRSGADMTTRTLAISYALAVGTACPLAYGLGKAFQRAPPSMKRFSFVASYVAVAAAGSMNVLFTRASEITGGVQVTDESGEVRGVSKKAGLKCVLQTVASRGMILPLPVVVLPAVLVGLLKRGGVMPTSPRARMWAQVAVITASLSFALPVSIAVFPQEARFKAESLEPELHNLRLRDGSRDVKYLYANKGLESSGLPRVRAGKLGQALGGPASASTNIGGRQRQEDKVVAVPDLNVHVPETVKLDSAINRSYFAVFDGHGGPAASSFLAKTFHVALAKNPLLKSDPKAALLDVWKSMDSEIYRILAQRHHENTSRANSTGGKGTEEVSFPRDGSTATVLLLVGNKLFTANCGDSSGILVKKDGSVRVITKNHDTLDKDEFERIGKLGGFYRNQLLRMPKRWPWCCFLQDVVVGKPRVYPGGLLVTRAFGDFSAKRVELGGTPGVILPDCEEVLEMTIEEDWSEVVIASDGVWDVVPTQEMPMLLARLEGKGAVAAARQWAASNGRNIENLTNNGKVSAPDVTVGDTDILRLKQAQLNGTCAKLILACVRHRYWELNQSAADNASAVILRFHPLRSLERSSKESPEGSRENGGSFAQQTV
eukprot:g3851.t1